MSSMISDENAFTCPTPSEIKQKSLQYSCLNNRTYHIIWNPQRSEYIEKCLVKQWISKGKATTLDKSGNINDEDCRVGTFQRSHYESNTQCACNETKGHCNKTGQVVASNGSTTEDRTCRCDFRRGYKFFIKPSNACVCQSSSEDCTCIKEECKTVYRMSPDYECVSENLCFTTNYTCKDYITSEESTTEYVPDSGISEMPTGMVQWNETAIIATCIAISNVFVCFLLGVLLENKCGIYALMRICCKKCRPFRNGSAPTNDEGTSKSKDSAPVQETGTSESEDSYPVQETGTSESEDSYPVQEKGTSESKDSYPVQEKESDVLIKMLPNVKMDKLENEVTYKHF